MAGPSITPLPHPTDLADAHAAAVLSHVLPIGEQLSDTIRIALADALGADFEAIGADPEHPEWHQSAIDITRELLNGFMPSMVDLLTDVQLASLLAGMQRVATLLPARSVLPIVSAKQPVVGASAVASPQEEIARQPRVVPSEAPRTTKVATPHGGPVDVTVGEEPVPTVGPAADRGREAVPEDIPELITIRIPMPPGLELPSGLEFPEITPAPPSPPEEPPLVTSHTNLPMIDEAARSLRARHAMTRADFDALSNEARRRAFTVAGQQVERTIEKVRDIAADLVEDGPTLREFKKRVEEQVGGGTFLSPAHAETVYRNNISQSFSDGMDKLLQMPMVGDAFPFAAVHAIHDDRVRKDHLEVEKIGLQGTNVFYRTDPVFIKYRGPWDYG